MFSERVQELFERIGATSTDIARYAECASSNISRLRAGSRVPKPNSATVGRLLDGVYLFAQDRNAMALLCSVFDGSSSDSEEAIKNQLCEWLYQGEQVTASSKPRKKAKRTAEHRTIPFRNFGDKLNAVMNMLDLSNVRLGRAINLDPSHICRFRGGVRSPKSNMLLVNQICDELLDRIHEQKKIPELAKLMNVGPDILSNEDMCEELFCKWLCDFEAQDDSLDRMLDSIDTFSPETEIPLPEFTAIATNEIVNSTEPLYWGTEGLREAVIRFLGNAIQSKASELWLYSDQDMNWMVGDRAFRMKWLALMVGCVKSRIKIKIIHTIDRDPNEMLAAIGSWLPLYMSGFIEPYVCKAKKDARFSHTLFLCPEHSCIYASHIRGNEDKSWYDFVTDSERLNIIGEDYELLVSQCEPLVKIYTDNNSFRIYETSLQNESSDLWAMLSSLSFGSMPQELLKKILARNQIADDVQNIIIDYHTTWQQRKKATLCSGNIREFIPVPSDEKLFDGKVKIHLGSYLFDKELYYTPEEYAEHMKAVLALMEENTNYHFYVHPESPYDDVQIIRQGDHVTVIKQNSPYAVFVFKHPYMLQAFDDYFEMMKMKYSSGRSEIKQMLTRFI